MLVKKFPASEYIKNGMEAMQINAAKLAEQSGISKKTISLLLNNKTPFTIKMDYLIAPVLGYDVGILSSLEAIYLKYENQLKKNSNSLSARKYKDLILDTWNYSKYIANSAALEHYLKKWQAITKISNNRNFKKNEFKLFFMQSFYKYLYTLENNEDSINELLINLYAKGVCIYFSDDAVDVRGMSKLENETYSIVINKHLNKSLDHLIFTIVHELFYLFIEEIFGNRSLTDEEYQQEVELLTTDYLLNHKLELLDTLNMKKYENIKKLADEYQINAIFLNHYLDSKNHSHSYSNQIIDYAKIKCLNKRL